MTVGEARGAVDAAIRLLKSEARFQPNERHEARWTIFGLETISELLDSAGETPDEIIVTTLPVTMDDSPMMMDLR